MGADKAPTEPAEIVILGAGGMGREIREMIERINLAGGRWHCVGFLVEAPFPAPPRVHDLPVVRGLEGLAAMPRASVVVAVGDPAGRQQVVRRIQARFGNPFATLVDPRAVCGAELAIGAGSIVAAGAVVTSDVAIGEHVIGNIGATVSHDTNLAAFVSLAPGVHLAGAVQVGEGADLGTGCAVVPRIRVGAWATVGAGAVVTEDVPANATVVGVPARVVRTRAPGWQVTG
ncbi:MAG TPA: acetyltransferase [Candidatus Limnocylindrales bacterium]|nr:acetyltransferase [Candidatus Limnocylindrales bacterium]